MRDSEPEKISMLYNLASRTIAPDEDGTVKVRVDYRGKNPKVRRSTGKPSTDTQKEMVVAPTNEPFALGEGPAAHGVPYPNERKMLRDALRRMLDEV